MSLIYRRPWTRQPRGVAAINLAHPLAQGLVGFWTPIGGRFVDVLDYSTPSANTASASVSAKGHTTLYNNTRTTYAHKSRYDVLGDITIAAEVDVVSLTGFGAILQKNNSDTTTLPYEFRIGKSSTTSDLVFVRGNTTFARFEGAEGDQISAGQTAFVAVTQDGSSIGTTPVFYVNGKTVASGAKIGTGTGAATTNSGSLYLGSRFDSVTYSNYAALYVALWSRSLSRAEIASFRANPWQIFATPPRRIWAPAAGGPDVTLALSGQAVTGSAGSIVNSRTLAASGQAATASAGTLPPSLSIAAAGSAVTVSAGSVVPSRTVALSGIVANASAGTVTPSVSLALSGTAVTSFAGTITYSISGDLSLALSGQAVAATPGTLAPSLSKAIAGTAATVSSGTITPALSAALSGVAVAASAGTVVPSRTVALAGSASTAGAGTIIYSTGSDLIVALSGQAVTTYAGTLSITTGFTSAGVLYLPIRMSSALWSAGAPSGGGEVAWLPPARQPVTFTDARTGQTFCDPAWYRFFEYIAEQRLGGKTGPSITTVVQTLTDTQTTAAAATSTVAELQQQTQANAESLYVVRSVAKLNLLDGAEQIPPVEL